MAKPILITRLNIRFDSLDMDHVRKSLETSLPDYYHICLRQDDLVNAEFSLLNAENIKDSELKELKELKLKLE
tara:strand:+ start:43 stop:261 length:219 start_codon:yes stop_codon:yes gene_type:complete